MDYTDDVVLFDTEATWNEILDNSESAASSLVVHRN